MTNKIKVSKTIPLPAISGRQALEKYPFRALKIGESFLIDPADENSALWFIYWIGRILNVKFKTKMTPQGRRVWKVSNNKSNCNANFSVGSNK